MKERDLSVMFIPEIDPTEFIDTFMFHNFDACQGAVDFYRKNGKPLKADDLEIDGKDFTRCLNLMKKDDPETFLKVYDYLREFNIIPASPIITDLNLTSWDQFDYIDSYEKGMSGRAFTMQLILHAVRKDPSAFEDIGRTCEAISNMRYGSVEDQERYYNFCSLPVVQTLNGLIGAENDLEDRAMKLVDVAEKKNSDKYVR